MPGWVWPVLVVLFVVVLVAGLAFAGWRAFMAVRSVARTGSRLSEPLSRLEGTDIRRREEPPIFTQPLSQATDRYSTAHAEVVRHRERIRDRHIEIWERWESFNDLDR